MTDLEDLARAALAVPAVQSAAIFLGSKAIGSPSGSPALALGGAAGIEGGALAGLIAAVQNPAHPIVQSMTDAAPSFDVPPMNPGGPALRSHIPLGGLGVLALAHETSLSPEERQALLAVAASAEAAIAGQA
jgi:hypothetical protein